MSSNPHSFVAITSEGGLLPSDFLQELLNEGFLGQRLLGTVMVGPPDLGGTIELLGKSIATVKEHFSGERLFLFIRCGSAVFS